MTPRRVSSTWSVPAGLIWCLCGAGAACSLPGVAPTGGGAPVLGECGLLPNYADSGLADQLPPRLLRWRSFPLRLHVDTAGLPSGARSAFEDAVLRGARTWDGATGGRIGAFDQVPSATHAQVVVRYTPGSTGAVTTVRYAGRLLRHADIEVRRPARDAESAAEGDEGPLAAAVASLVSHEMGHALGIMLHSPDRGDLMAGIMAGGAVRGVTAADRHTLLEAYCR